MRIAVKAALFFTFWLGLGWTRWLLAFGNFFSGGWLVSWSLYLGGRAAVTLNWLPLALGGFDLLAAGWFAFSADFSVFLRHRREHRRASQLVFLGALLALYLGMIFSLRLVYGNWQARLERGARAFTEQHLSALADQRSQEEFDRLATPGLLAHWPAERRRRAFEELRRFGPLRRLSPVQGRAELRLNGVRGMFAHAFYSAEAEFDKGRSSFDVELVGAPTGGDWKVDAFYARWPAPPLP